MYPAHSAISPDYVLRIYRTEFSEREGNRLGAGGDINEDRNEDRIDNSRLSDVYVDTCFYGSLFVIREEFDLVSIPSSGVHETWVILGVQAVQ